MDSPVKQRLIAYIEAKGLKKHQFEKKCGLSVGYVANIRSSVSPEKTMAITSMFPDLNTDWLLTGRGCMFLDSPDTDDSSQTNDYDTFIKELREENYRLMQTIQQLNDRITELNGIISRQNEEIYRLMNERKAYRTG